MAVGDRLRDSVRPADEVCWKMWDATGRCRGYSLVAPENGHLMVSLSWEGGEPMDVFIVLNGGSSTIWDSGSSPKTDLAAGQRFAIVVMSFAPPQDFVLETSFQP